MELSGEHTFSAPREKVWQFLLDPDVLKSCLPGCEKLDVIGPDEYHEAVDVNAFTNVMAQWNIERAVGKRLPRVILPDFDYRAKPEGQLEIPIAERIAAIRAKKAEDRARSAAKKQRKEAQVSGSSGTSRGRPPSRQAPAGRPSEPRGSGGGPSRGGSGGGGRRRGGGRGR